MSLLQPNKVQSIFFLLQFRVRNMPPVFSFYLHMPPFFECALVSFEFVYSFTPFMWYSRQSNYQLINTEINCVSSAWPYGLMSGCPAVISSPPLPLMLCLALPSEGSQVSWKKTQSFGFNLILFLQWKTTCKQDVAVVEMLTCSRAFLAIDFF